MERIFRDYEIQINAIQQREVEADAREVRRAEYAKIQQLDRLAAQEGETLTLGVAGAQTWQGRLLALGDGWVQLKTRTENVLIPQRAISWWEGGNKFSYAESGSVRRRLSLGYALRALSSARMPVRVFHLFDRVSTEGTIEKVGADFIEIALHGIEGAYRSTKILGLRVISTSHIAAVCSPLVL